MHHKRLLFHIAYTAWNVRLSIKKAQVSYVGTFGSSSRKDKKREKKCKKNEKLSCQGVDKD
jgi:hypothetical protein